MSEREESLDSQIGIMWGETPIEKGLRLEELEKVLCEGEGEEGLKGIV